MFNIEGTHITELNDTDLRILIARLCEAELQRTGHPVSAVIAGGNQNAADGGLDVRIDLPKNASGTDFIPRPKTGFQVKVPDMPRAEILKEMRPKGSLRQVISELSSLSGAYIIVSSNGSTTDSALRRRKDAMHEALTGAEHADSLSLDFYDRERIATWVRCYPGIVAWVRGQIGQPLSGWLPYSSWAAPDENIDAEYLIDDKYRLVDEQTPRDGALDILEGMQRIRMTLATHQGTIRLVGLSGTGKTRFAQALFDERIGGQLLDSAIVVYADLGLGSEPSPHELLRHLIQNEQRAIVIVDNCPPKTHKALANACVVPESKLSLMTIEYDVGDDAPEKTDVFRLHPSSEGVIERLLESHAPQTSQVDRRHIAELSDGNARVALALAHTVQRGESVSVLSDRDIFNRLFYQGRQPNQSLLRSAEAISLVYSFNGEDMDGDTAELPLLASIAGHDSDEIYRNITELRSRELVQARGKWRALLPQALANRLAHQALERMHPVRVANTFTKQSPEHLLLSFSRRLGFLHDSECAQQIACSWLSEGGFLSSLHDFNALGLAMFQNVAPVQPVLALDAIERVMDSAHGDSFVAVSNNNRDRWSSLLRSLAFDPDLYEKAILLIVRFVIAEPPNHNVNSARDKFRNLFQLCLSGTHATVDQRLRIVDSLIQREEKVFQDLGFTALGAMMEAWHFSSSHEFTFGAHPRDYGWEPKTLNEQGAWFNAVIDYATALALSDKPYSEDAKALIANNFRGMLIKDRMIDHLEAVATELASQNSWLEGWKAIRQTIFFDAKDMPKELSDRLRRLEEQLRPQTLEQRIRAYVLCERWGTLDISDGEPVADENDASATQQRVEQIAEQLGHEAGANFETLKLVLPELVSGSLGLGWQFGRGLAFEISALSGTWQLLVDALSAAPEKTRNLQVLRGFISGANERDAGVTGALLDSAITHPVLGPVFPNLQTSTVKIDALGIERLQRAISTGQATSEEFISLSFGGVVSSTPPILLRQLLLSIATLDGGHDIAIHILGMRLHSERDNKTPLDMELVRCGQELLCTCPFDKRRTTRNHHLGEIGKACFVGEDASEAASLVCRNFIVAMSDHGVSAFDYKALLKALFRWQPIVALNEFIGEQPSHEVTVSYSQLNGRFPVHEASAEAIMSWGQVNPNVRFPRLASVLSPFEIRNGDEVNCWSKAALMIIDLAPDKEAVLERFASNFIPSGWSGSLAFTLHGRRALPQALFEHPDPIVATKARELDDRLLQQAQREAEREREWSHQTDESFE